MPLKKNPHGLSDYREVRQEQCYYLDKTMYIPKLEETGKYLFFIRPRRFGKSLLLSMLECYYDVATLDDFDMLFKGTYIYDQPTPEKNRYLILSFNFSQLIHEVEHVAEAFNDYLSNTLIVFTQKYHTCFDDTFYRTFERNTQAHQKLQFTLAYLSLKGYRCYAFIDEYDNFTNTIMATHGSVAYQNITHRAGFYRAFFSILKAAAGRTNSSLARIFITGVSPVTMDDMTSGFNIGEHISLQPEFSEILGFTEQDVCDMLHYYGLPIEEIVPLMKQWYNNYRFSRKTQTYLFNTDMALYFIKQYLKHGEHPEELIDHNVKIDYGKLRHLMVLNNQLNGNFGYLQNVIATRQIRGTHIAVSFPMEYLTKPTNFISLLYYFGLLSYAPDNQHLMVPNETVMQLLYSYVRDGFEDLDIFRVDMWRLGDMMWEMAYRGNWRPVFAFLEQEVYKQTSVRDYLMGEKVIKTFLLSYLNIINYYTTYSEYAIGKGYVDLYLEPFWVHHPDICYAYMIELKYITRGDWSDAVGQKSLAVAKKQLQHYAQDWHATGLADKMQLICIAMVYSGWELKLMEAC